MAKRKTLDEHVHSCRELAKLKLWFAWSRAREHPQEDITFILRCRTHIYGLTAFGRGKGRATEQQYADPAWQKLLQPALAVYQAHRDDTDASAFEREAFEVLRHAVEDEALATYNDGAPPQASPYGCLRFDPPRAEHPTRVHFHINNPLQPRSIFDDREYLPGCFFRLVDAAQAQYGADALTTGTWLNSLPRWLELFPREYLDNMGPEEVDIRWGGGFWGQFTNARGAFNEKYGRVFRQTGRLLFNRRESWCSIAAMRAHLKQYLALGDGGQANPDGPRH